MTQTSIKQLCQKFGKKPSHFIDNRSVIQPHQYSVTRGRNGDTKIDDDLIPQFLVWLHPAVAGVVYSTGWRDGLAFANACDKDAGKRYAEVVRDIRNYGKTRIK